MLDIKCSKDKLIELVDFIFLVSKTGSYKFKLKLDAETEINVNNQIGEILYNTITAGLVFFFFRDIIHKRI